MKNLLLALGAVLLLGLAVPAQAALIEATCMASGDANCLTPSARQNYAKAVARLHFKCWTGFESTCTVAYGSTHQVHLTILDTPQARRCVNTGVIFNITVTSTIDPISGATGRDFVSTPEAFHCEAPSGLFGCNNQAE